MKFISLTQAYYLLHYMLVITVYSVCQVASLVSLAEVDF